MLIYISSFFCSFMLFIYRAVENKCTLREHSGFLLLLKRDFVRYSSLIFLVIYVVWPPLFVGLKFLKTRRTQGSRWSSKHDGNPCQKVGRLSREGVLALLLMSNVHNFSKNALYWLILKYATSQKLLQPPITILNNPKNHPQPPATSHDKSTTTHSYPKNNQKSQNLSQTVTLLHFKC